MLGLGLLVGLSGCGGSSPGTTASDDPVRSTDFLISSADLPRGWADSNSQGVDYRLTVCGVDIEPSPPGRATSIRFSQGPVGPFLEQHVRVYDDDVVSGVVAGLRQALPGCSEYEAQGTDPESPTARFTVEPLTVAGAPDDSVAWRQTSQGQVPITSDLVLVPRGDTAVMLMSYALRDTPDPRVLEQAVAALPER